MKLYQCTLFFILYMLAFANANATRNSLKGVVYGPRQKPVEDAQIEFYRFNWEKGYKLQGEPQVTKTDTNGQFSIAVEPFDSMTVLAQKKGLSWGWKVIQAGQSSVGVQLAEPATFSGQVVDEAGTPIAEASVQIIRLSKIQKRNGQGDPLSNPEVLQMFSVKTDAQGQFVMSGLPAGAGFDIGIRRDGYAVSSYFGSGTLRYAHKAGTTGHRFVLEPEAILSGKAIDIKTGKAASDIPVHISSRSKPGYNPFPKVKTDQQGHFSFRGLGADTYTLYFDYNSQSCLRETQTVKLTKGQHKTDFQVSLSRGGTLEIKVVNANTQQPIEKASVFVQCKTKKHKTTLKTGADGFARRRYLPDDFYITEVEAQGYRRDLTERPLTIEDGKTNSVTLTLEEYPRLEAMVVRPDGTPAADITVHLLHGFIRKDPKPMSRGLSKGPKIPRSVLTDLTGRFVFWLNATAAELEDNPEAYPVFAYTAEQNLFVADKVPFGLMDTTLKLKPGVKVVGSLVDQHGHVVDEGAVNLHVIYQTGPNRTSSQSMGVKPGYDGRFEFAGVPSDSQGLSLNYYCERYKSFNGKVDPSQIIDGVIQLQPITVHRAAVVVKGQVLLPDGKPVASANVSTMDFYAGYDNDVTGEQGYFELTLFKLPVEITASKNIPPGGYYSEKIYVTDKDKDVVITIRTAEDKESFLPIVSPQPNSTQTRNKHKNAKITMKKELYSEPGYSQLPKDGGILFGAYPPGQAIDDFVLDEPLQASKIRWWGRDVKQADFTIRFFKNDGSGIIPVEHFIELSSVHHTKKPTPFKQFRGVDVFEYETVLEKPLLFERQVKYYIAILNKTNWAWFNSNSTGESWWWSDDEQSWHLRERPSADLAFELIP